MSLCSEGQLALMRVSLESIGRDTSYSHEPIIPPQYRQVQPTAHSHRRPQKGPGHGEKATRYVLQPSNFSRFRDYLSCLCAAIPCGWLDLNFWKSSNFRRNGLCLLALRPLRICFFAQKGHVPRSMVSGITLVSPPQGIKGIAKTPKQCHCRIDQLGKKH